MIRPLAVAALVAFGACAAQTEKQPKPALAPDGSPLVTTDAEFAAYVLGPPQQCASMLRDAADPEGLCGCLKSVALDVNAHGASEGTPTVIKTCIRSYSGGRNITPKKPRL